MKAVGSSLLILLLTALCLGSVRRVPEDYPTIQAALDSAQWGDTVLVQPGLYAEALIAPPLPFLLTGYDDSTTPATIDPARLPRSDTLYCLMVPPESAPTLKHLQFRNGPEMFPRTRGIGGIRLFAPELTVGSCRFDSTRWAIATGIEDLIADVHLADCEFEDCVQGCIGLGRGRLTATACSFSGSCRLYHVQASDESEIRGCRFQAIHDSFGVFLNAARNTVVEACTFEQFGPGYGAAVRVSGFTGRIVGNTFLDTRHGHAALSVSAPCEGDTVVIRDNLFLNCGPAWGGSGQAVGALSVRCDTMYPEELFGFDVSQNIFYQCHGNMQAGALQMAGGAAVEQNRFDRIWSVGSADWRPAIVVALTRRTFLRHNLLLGDSLAAQVPNNNFELDAVMNWWGDPSGPYHFFLNPQGRGLPVADHVLFIPWMRDTLLAADDDLIKDRLGPANLSVWPNPFNRNTIVKVWLPQRQRVTLTVYDVLGRRVRDLANDPLDVGDHAFAFSAKDLSSGIYFVRLHGENLVSTRKVLLLR